MGATKVIRVAIGIITDGRRLLITRRPEGVPLAGYWEFPGGKLEPGEPAEAAVQRELLEEIGVTAHPVRQLDSVIHTYEHATVELIPLICHLTAGQPQALACQELRWVEPNELAKYTFPAGNVGLLAALVDYPLPCP